MERSSSKNIVHPAMPNEITPTNFSRWQSKIKGDLIKSGLWDITTGRSTSENFCNNKNCMHPYYVQATSSKLSAPDTIPLFPYESDSNDFAELNSSVPPPGADTVPTSEKADHDWKRLHQRACEIILFTMDQPSRDRYVMYQDPRELWSRLVEEDPECLFNINRQFELTNLLYSLFLGDGGNPRIYVQHINTLARQLSNSGRPVSTEEKLFVLTKGLLGKWLEVQKQIINNDKADFEWSVRKLREYWEACAAEKTTLNDPIATRTLENWRKSSHNSGTEVIRAQESRRKPSKDFVTEVIRGLENWRKPSQDSKIETLP